MRLRFLLPLLAGVIVQLSGVYAAAQLPDRRAVRPAPPPRSATGTSNDAVLDLLNDIEDLKSQLRQLRGQLEVQGHQIEQIKNGQRQSLVDMDRRLREIEQRSMGAGANTPTGMPPIGSPATPPPGMASAPAPTFPPVARSRPSAAEQAQYDAAFALMKQGRYQQAAAKFHDFVAQNPKSGLADNAQYWVGEAAYVTRDFRSAIEEFGKVVSNYPQSPKVPDALLKIGYTHYELGAYDRARQTLSQVMARYPNTAVAKSAELRIERITKEGH